MGDSEPKNFITPIEADLPKGTLAVKLGLKKVLDEENIQQIGRELFAIIDSISEGKTFADCKEDKLQNFVIDMSGVEYLAAAALGKLFTAEHKLKNIKAKLNITGLSDATYEVFKITRLDKVINVTQDSLEDWSKKQKEQMAR